VRPKAFQRGEFVMNFSFSKEPFAALREAEVPCRKSIVNCVRERGI
jgi:hypothetical protein